MVTHAITEAVIKSIPVEQIDPNPWNPNRMDEERFQEYVAEVRRLGRLPKPVVVRKQGNRHQIIDGEHGWRAAQEVGLPEILCELIEVDDFAARRETFKRNQRGEHDRVLEGRMFIEMSNMQGLNNCQLAEVVGVSEGTIRNSLEYADAAERRRVYLTEQAVGRNSCESAGGSDRNRNCYELNQADADVAKLTVRRLRIYLSLPEIIRDKWLDAGGHDALLAPFMGRSLTALADQLRPIADHGLADLINGTFIDFRGSLSYTLDLADWIDGHAAICDAAPYVRAVAERRLDVSLLEHLPCRREDDKVEVLLSPDEWKQLLEDASLHADNKDDLQAVIDSGVRVTLRRKGVDLAKLLGPQVAELMQVLEDAPDFIRDADHLTLGEQVMLHRFDSAMDSELIDKAKRTAVERLKHRRCSSRQNGPGPDGDIQKVVEQCVSELRDQALSLGQRAAASTRRKLHAAVVSQLDLEETINDATVNGRPAGDVLMEEINNLTTPMLALLSSALSPCESATSPAREWLMVSCSPSAREWAKPWARSPGTSREITSS